MHGEYKGVSYAAGVHTHTFGEYQVFIAGNSDDNEYLRINGEFDFGNNIVFFKVPKILVGSPEQGDILTSTDAWTALRYRAELLTLLHGDGEIKIQRRFVVVLSISATHILGQDPVEVMVVLVSYLF